MENPTNKSFESFCFLNKCLHILKYMNHHHRYRLGNQIVVNEKGFNHEGYEIILISDLCIMYIWKNNIWHPQCNFHKYINCCLWYGLNEDNILNHYTYYIVGHGWEREESLRSPTRETVNFFYRLVTHSIKKWLMVWTSSVRWAILQY